MKKPKEIYLQIGEGQEDEEQTWCEDEINKSDVKYIRVDMVLRKLRNAEISCGGSCGAGCEYAMQDLIKRMSKPPKA